MEIVINSDRVEQLKLYSELLKKDVNRILDEALELYFYTKEKELLEKNLESESAQTSLDYNEFWDGVDID
jgi:hypothetical protein